MVLSSNLSATLPLLRDILELLYAEIHFFDAPSLFRREFRFVVGLRGRDHVTGALIELHWLPVRYRITYKLCTLMHVYGHAPQYLSDMMVRVSQLAGRSHLRSAHKGAYNTPRIRTLCPLYDFVRGH